MKNKRLIVTASCLLCCLMGGVAVYRMTAPQTASTGQNHPDGALLALIKNDQQGFVSFVKSGGDLHSELPVVDGKTLTVAEGLAHYERVAFIKYLQEHKIPFVKQNKDGSDDIVSLAVAKNNPELLQLIMKEKPDLNATYGAKKQNLLHIASASCSSRLADILQKDAGLKVDSRQADGANAMTLAAEANCLPMLSSWKQDLANKDGRGKSAISILKENKALSSFVTSMEGAPARKPASVAAAPVEVNFYKKRKTPKDDLADRSALVEPEIRPLDAVETAEYSEFSD